jgi:hypothetical protein
VPIKVIVAIIFIGREFILSEAKNRDISVISTRA